MELERVSEYYGYVLDESGKDGAERCRGVVSERLGLLGVCNLKVQWYCIRTCLNLF